MVFNGFFNTLFIAFADFKYESKSGSTALLGRLAHHDLSDHNRIQYIGSVLHNGVAGGSSTAISFEKTTHASPSIKSSEGNARRG